MIETRSELVSPRRGWHLLWCWSLLLALLLPGCRDGGPARASDASPSDASPSDASPSDVSPSDVSPVDVSPSDAQADLDHGVVGPTDGNEGGCLKPPDGPIDAPWVDAWSEAGGDGHTEDATVDAAGDGLVDAARDGLVDAARDGLVDAARDGPVTDGPAGPCPPCMVLVAAGGGVGAFCVDRYEASRPDASVASQGSQTGPAQCVAGVLPWHSSSLTRAEAAQACAAAGKRLCAADEWQRGCSGPLATVYAYGDLYDPVICNGIDRFCRCGPGETCDGVSPCPYPGCFKTCGAALRLMPTGSLPACANAWGAYDMNGNAWELIEAGDGIDHFRGGAFNCIDSELLHRCDHDVSSWSPLTRGFRCCADPLSGFPPQG